jgi:predicted metalloprotease with PDZ domain
VGEPWSAPVRIAVAAEVLHAWIGGRLWIGPDDAAHEAEAYWFTEGVARGFARELLFRFGLITAAELIEEVQGLAALVSTSPLRRESNSALAARAREPGVLPLLVARGALYAARADVLVRKKSGGKRRLDDVLRALYERAKEKRAALPTSAWSEALAAEAGAGEPEAFAAAIEKGAALELPEGVFGPCFRSEKRRYQLFDFGFDEEATRAAPRHVIAGLRPGGPAERAGLRAGDELAETQATRGRSDVPVTLTVQRGGESKRIRYLPAGAYAPGPGWSRRKDVGDEACAR